ncbi:MAG TPA: hypothetical protein VKZ53_04705 [Candidatus Angelobacter sp.]|nr:hypothetical protein [Candidatus Angelobacter sp.]
MGDGDVEGSGVVLNGVGAGAGDCSTGDGIGEGEGTAPGVAWLGGVCG